MEKVTTFKREKNKRSFSKLKINTGDRANVIIDKIIKFICKDLNDYDLANFSDYLKFNNFSVSEIKELPERESNMIRNKFYKKDRANFYQAYSISIVDKKLKKLTVLTNTVDISSTAKNTVWDFPNFGRAQRVCNIKYIYGMLKLLDLTYEYCMSNKDILTESFKEFSIFNNSYSEDDLAWLIDLEKLVGVCTIFSIPGKIIKLIVDVILIRQSSDYNIELMENYNREIHSEVARAFETKKNIPKKVSNVMKSTKFLENFTYVELDEDTDLNKFKLVEKEFLRIRRLFDMENIKKPELRIRKLGKHKALGLYYMILMCLCVDITSPMSFMHEFGHHLDYTLAEKPLSLHFNFIPVIRAYTLLYDSQIGDDKYLLRKRKYFLTPTEIFARTFEMYLVNKGVITSLLKDKDEMTINCGYPADIDNSFMSVINSYFDSFKFNFEGLKVEDDIKNTIEDTIRKINIEDIKYTEIKQVCFF